MKSKSVSSTLPPSLLFLHQRLSPNLLEPYLAHRLLDEAILKVSLMIDCRVKRNAASSEDGMREEGGRRRAPPLMVLPSLLLPQSYLPPITRQSRSPPCLLSLLKPPLLPLQRLSNSNTTSPSFSPRLPICLTLLLGSLLQRQSRIVSDQLMSFYLLDRDCGVEWDRWKREKLAHLRLPPLLSSSLPVEWASLETIDLKLLDNPSPSVRADLIALAKRALSTDGFL